MKTPEEYITESVFIPEEVQKDCPFSDAEQAFIDKYLGMDGEQFLAKVPRVDPREIDIVQGAAQAAPAKTQERLAQTGPSAPVVSAPVTPMVVSAPAEEAPPSIVPEAQVPAASAVANTGADSQLAGKAKGQGNPAATAPDKPLNQEKAAPVKSVHAAAPAREEEKAEDLRFKEGLQLVSFLLDAREMALPIQCIQEVIRYIEPTKIPSAQVFVSGVINLRGKVTPLLNLRALMGQRSGQEGNGKIDRFIVVCRHKGLQVGLIVTAISTMYRPPARDIEWNVESQVGISSAFVAGLMKKDDKLINILSIDQLVDRVIAR
ncbi:chemotaxis signal transduction protein [Desulfocurvibacter africanus PCS]|uniref:Chemotaxis signal transduction protein n=1 Tax=Desulfocurvibacter africanus PCS TaxID=1262666 RepID=M5PWM7_DESAF|nr:chemotaxis protein CheW [Desulfocurvibacter africanus]EMG38717.1 chemotaxis signal transduction protein [Desulfocurvibacter africanus PCS]